MQPDMDGVYNRRRWDDEPDEWSYLGPFASNSERLLQQALTPMFMTAEEIQQNVQTTLPQVAVFRPRFGYDKYQDRQVHIEDLVGLSRRIETPASSWYSGGPAGYTGSSRYESNSLGLA